MKIFHTLIGFALSITLMTFISGCGGGSSSSTPIATTPTTQTGTIALSITDAPPQLPEDVIAVNIRVIGIEFNYDGNWTDVNDFEDNAFDGITLNLLDWQEGRALHLGDFKVPAGHYTEIRFKLAAPVQGENPKNNPDCNITFENEIDGLWSEPLFVPSGAQSGYKGKGEFDIEANAKLAVTADFDVYKSIVVKGNGTYSLKPVIRLLVDELSGWINGTVVDVETYTDIEEDLFVYAYTADTYLEDEVLEDNDGIRFINAISSTDVNMTDGNFTLAFLGTGTYDLITAHDDGSGELLVVDVEEDVEVIKATETLVDINTSDNTL